MNEAVEKFRGLTRSVSLGVTTSMGGGPSLVDAANAIAAFDKLSRATAARTA